jgi:integrase
VIAQANEMGYPSVGLGTRLGICTAQRPGDLLALRWNQYNGETIKLTQSKTKAVVEIPVSPDLKAALDAAKACLHRPPTSRWRGRPRGSDPDYSSAQVEHVGDNVVTLSAVRGDDLILVNDFDGRRWVRDYFGEIFRRAATKAGIPDTLQFRDLRRTAVVWMAEAGCTPQEIASMTGHAISNVHYILKVYCPLNLTMARNALVKLEDYQKRRSEG